MVLRKLLFGAVSVCATFLVAVGVRGAETPESAQDPITGEMRHALGRINKVHNAMDQKDIDEAVEALHGEIARHEPTVFLPLAIPHLMRLAPRDTQTRVLLRRALARSWLQEEIVRAYLVKAGDAPGPHIKALVKALDDTDPKVRTRAAKALGATGAAGAAALPKLREIVAKARADPSDYRRAYTLSHPMPEHIIAHDAILEIESVLGRREPSAPAFHGKTGKKDDPEQSQREESLTGTWTVVSVKAPQSVAGVAERFNGAELTFAFDRRSNAVLLRIMKGMENAGVVTVRETGAVGRPTAEFPVDPFGFERSLFHANAGARAGLDAARLRRCR
jgi:hypothetical protein